MTATTTRITKNVKPVSPARPSAHMTAEHDEIREQLLHLKASLAELDDETVRDRRRTMDRVIAFFEDHIEHHTKREDRELFPRIERHLGSPWLTATLRSEHRFLIDGFDSLRRIAAEPIPDDERFRRLVDGLVVLLFAHLEAEERVIFPVVDEMAAAGALDQ